MPTSTQIDAQDDAVLDALEVERVREIVGAKTTAEITGKTDSLTAVQRQATRADIAAWDAVGDGTVAVKGGRDGADYSQARDRGDIRVRVRLRLGLEPYDPTLNPDAARMVWVESDYIAEETEEF